MSISLYEDQEEFLGDIRKLWPYHKRIACLAPTGFGKTRVAAKIIEGCVSRGFRVCFVVPRISLVVQTAKVFLNLGIKDITYIWSGQEESASARVAIASVDTLIRREKPEFDLFIIDEVDNRRRQLLQWMEEHPEDRYLGLSATLFEPWLGRYYTALAKAKPMWWLIENKRLSPYEVFAPTKPDLSGCKVVNTEYGKDYRESDISEVMSGYKLVGDIVSNWLKHGENRPTMLLGVGKDHVGHLAREFNKYGVQSELIVDKTPIEEREMIFDRVRSGITKIVLSVDCLTMGFDMVEITCLINARPTKSKRRFIQGIGRLLRYAPGKVGLVFDHAGSFLDPELGFVEYIDIDELPGSSDGMKESERVKKEIERLEKSPKECPKCSYLKPAGVYQCPKCGFKPLSGEDVETDVTRELTRLRKSLDDKPREPTKEEKQAFYAELVGYQKERQAKGKRLSDGWLSHTYKDKFGVWPKGLDRYPKVPSPETRKWIQHKMIKFAKGRKRANG